jgi:polyisoprenoid-binding protein YceI
MKYIITALTFLVFLNTKIAQDFNINSENAIVEFNYLVEEAFGTIKGVSGKIHFDISDLSKSSFEVSANIPSINTSNKTRDKHLNAKDYFYTEKYPAVIFKSTSITADDDEFVLSGNMKIKEITKPENINFKFENNVFIGRCVIYSNDYNIHKRKTREDSKILVKITVPVL